MENWIQMDEATLVCEMSNKSKAQTKLPMNIWIDENQTYIKGRHSKRVKFQLNHAKPLAYSHGKYYGLGEKIGGFGFSVKKKK